MKITVKAKPHSNQEKIEENYFIVSVKELPVKGAANKAIILALAEYFEVPKSSIKLLSGFSSKNKTFEIT
ncbi:MAG: hypothetical protein A2172_03415 [Candidatus Woykebacteria bacterium RBG_13_40_15]|uniref:Uncharacterized protein n=1 Tax=Candidatus Woykebacteria bacterium RBG_13_40_15 TaxID=1802593 RepID=A0A1G1W5J6_9BACT|nr:MAG: hypothetical protein A2172_03415 [Candidatus Woykebacteria bacterium RBG_13_40_15]